MVKNQTLMLSMIMLSICSVKTFASVENEIVNSQSKALSQGKAALSENFLDNLVGSKSERTEQGAHQAMMNFETPQPQTSQKETASNNIKFTILISDAMGERELLNLFKSLEHRDDVSFSIRGLLPTERTINDAARRIMRIIRKGNFKKVPHVVIDPRPFESVQAEFAPQILMYKGDDIVLAANGLSNPNYMIEQYELGKKGDLGSFGATVKISEINLKEIIASRSEDLDKEKILKEAKENYWENVTFLSLPKAHSTTTRTFAPIVTLHEDIVAPDGSVVAYQGETFNTLLQLPFTQRIVVFDATDKAEMAFVKSLPDYPMKTRYITTKFDRSLKWDAITHIQEQLGSKVFKLNTDITNGFDVRVTPSVIVADNDKNVFVINEYYLDSDGEIIQ